MDLSVSQFVPAKPLLSPPLLSPPTIILTVDGATVAPTGPGTFSFNPGTIAPTGGAAPSTVRLHVVYRASAGGVTSPMTSPALDVDQTFSVGPLSLSPFLSGAITPLRYAVPGAGDHAGLHPLLSSIGIPSIGDWRVLVNTTVVDVTPLLSVANLNLLQRSTPNSSVRVLARTDGTKPVFWVTATPLSCRSAVATDLLCFLTPPQRSPASSGNPATDLATPDVSGAVMNKVAFFLGGPTATGVAGPLFPFTLNRFTPGPVLPNFTLARGFESA